MIVNATSSKRVTLGRLGENKTRTIRFDIREMKEEFPGAEFMVLNRRPTESAAYPVSSSYVTVNGHHLDWTVQSGDLLYQGMGECEIVASVDDKIAKTQIYLTEVLKALDGAGNPPAPWKSWVDDVEDAADRAEAAAAVAVHAPEIVEGVWYVWDAEQGEYVTTGVTAEGQDGQPGQDGYSPAATVSKSGSTATISITDKNGTTTASVSDGDPSAIIDDTAGSGDTGKVWSANKSAELLSALNVVKYLLTEEVPPSANIFDGNFDESGYIDNNGADASSSSYKRTSKYYPIDTTKTKLYSFREAGTLNTMDMFFYNSSKVYLSKVGFRTEYPKEIDIPEGAAYFRAFKDASYTGGVTIAYTSVDHYIPYVESGTVVKKGIIGHDNLTAEFQNVIDNDTDLITAIAEKKATLNLFDNDFDESGYIDNGNGDKPSSNYKRTSKYYPIDDSNETLYSYNEEPGGTQELIFYNAAKEYLDHKNIQSESTSKTIPQGAKYFRAYRNASRTGLITITYTFEHKSIPYRRWTGIKDDCVGFASMDDDAKAKLTGIYGKKILIFGDSIIGNDRTEGVCDYLAEYSGATVYNGAIGGTRITDLRSSQYDSPNVVYFDGVKLIHALMTDTWTDQDTYVTEVPDYVASDTLPMLKTLDVSKLDMIVIAYGRNDITSSETLQNIKDAIDTIIDDIQSHYPAVRILVLTPIWGMFSSGTVDGDSYESTSGMTLRTMTDGMLSQAKARHVSSCDMLENMQLSQNTMATYMDNDHVHLNSAGNAMYAHILNGKLRSLF